MRLSADGGDFYNRLFFNDFIIKMSDKYKNVYIMSY